MSVSKISMSPRCFRTCWCEYDVCFKNINMSSVFSCIPTWVLHLFQKYEYSPGIFAHPDTSVMSVSKIWIFHRYFRTCRCERDVCSKKINVSSVFSYIPIWVWHVSQKYEYCFGIFVCPGMSATFVSKISILPRYFRAFRCERDVYLKNANMSSVFSGIPTWAWSIFQKCEHVIGVFVHPDMSVKSISKIRIYFRYFRTSRYECDIYSKNMNMCSVFSCIRAWAWHMFQKYAYFLGIFVHPDMGATSVPKI